MIMSSEENTNYGELSESEFNLWINQNSTVEIESNKKINTNIKCKCCNKNIIPIDVEYFDNIIPSISTLFKNKSK